MHPVFLCAVTQLISMVSLWCLFEEDFKGRKASSLVQYYYGDLLTSIDCFNGVRLNTPQ